jgi:hypothetical protein
MSYPWFKRVAARHFPNLILPGAAYDPTARGHYDFKRLFDANIDREQIFLTSIKMKDSNEAIDQAWESQYQLLPYGLSFKVVDKNRPVSFPEYVEESAKYLPDPRKFDSGKPLKGSWDSVVQTNYWLAHHFRAAEILKYGIRTQDRTYLKMAEELLEDLVTRIPAPEPEYFKNLGIAHQHLMKMTEGMEQKRHESRMLETWSVFVQKGDRLDKSFDDIQNNLRAFGRLPPGL